MPRLVAGSDLARSFVDRLGEVAGEWVIVDWRETVTVGPGFLPTIERLLYDRGAKVAHHHHPRARGAADAERLERRTVRDAEAISDLYERIAWLALPGWRRALRRPPWLAP